MLSLYPVGMEPVTHMLTGAVLARTGLNRRAAYATIAMALAAEMPDLDTVWSLGGPVTGFEHHRGITHTIVGLPFEAAIVVAVFWAVHRLRGRPATKAPVRWGSLYGFALLALLSHLLLDWTNNYGIRPFFPFNPHWYAGSFVFIFEPVMFLLLLIGLVAPALFGLIGSEVGVRKAAFAGRGWATFAIVGVLALWIWRAGEHGRAIALATQTAPAGTTRVFASPHPTNPWRWSVVEETPATYQLGTVNTRAGTLDPPEPGDTLYKPETTLALLAAKRTYLGRVYLDWSMLPVLKETAGEQPAEREITFADARFLYRTTGMDGRRNPPISGTVLLNMAAPEGQRVEQMRMGTREQQHQ